MRFKSFKLNEAFSHKTAQTRQEVSIYTFCGGCVDLCLLNIPNRF